MATKKATARGTNRASTAESIEATQAESIEATQAESIEATQQNGAAALVVRTRRSSPRRRAGLSFGREPVRIEIGALTEAQIAAIEADPLLVVEREG